MKIGLVTGEYPPMEGGVGAFTQELGRALAALGHEIHIITSRDARPEPTERSLRTANNPHELDFGTLHAFMNRWRWPSVARAADIVIREELDVVNLQYQPAAFNMRSPAINFLPWRLKGVVKNVVTFHDLRVPYLFPKAGPLRQRVVTKMARDAHGLIATNSADFTALQQRAPKVPRREIPIGSNITTHAEQPTISAEIRASLSLPDNGVLIGYFGFLNASKGADDLLAALAQLDDRHHLLFIGGQTGASDATNQAYLDHIRQQVSALRLDARVHWTGFQPDERVSAYLHACDLMAMPYKDGASLRRGTLMAVLAHGRALITTTPTVATPDLIHAQNCWLVQPNDPIALQTAIETVGSQPQLRTDLGRGAAQLADQFTWDKIAQATAAFYGALLA